MTDFYLVKTMFGAKSLPQGTKIYVELKDGKFAPMPVELAAVYAGKSKTVYLKNKLNVAFSELEQSLMDAMEGDFTDYRKAKLQLHEEKNKILVPKLAAILQTAVPDGEQKIILDAVHKKMEDYAKKHDYQTVARSQINEWFRGNEIAPRDWRNFAALANAKEIHPSLSEFNNFYGDYVSFDSSKKETNDVEDNLYYAYLFYVVSRIYLGKNAESGFKKHVNYDASKEFASDKKVNLDALKKFIGSYFYKDIDQDHCAVPLLSVNKIESKKNKSSQSLSAPSTAVNPLYNGVYVVKNENNGVNLSKKTQKEAITDAVVLERSLFNQIHSVIHDVCKERIDFANEGDELSYHCYVYYNLEEKIRKCKIEKDICCLTPEQSRDADRLSSEIYRLLFESQEGNQRIGVSKNSLQKLKDCRALTVPVYPNVMEDFLIAKQNLKFLNVLGEPIEQSRKRSFNDRIARYARIVNENLEQTDKLTEEYELKQLPSEAIANFVYRFRTDSFDRDAEFHTLKSMMKENDFVKSRWQMSKSVLSAVNPASPVRRPFYDEEDIRNVLNSYNLEEFIEKDFDIAFWRKLKSGNL